jgi:hypothetical protein
MVLASVSYGQDVVICSPSALTGGPDIVAELGICPRGYMEVRRTANSSGNTAWWPARSGTTCRAIARSEEISSLLMSASGRKRTFQSQIS